MSTKSIINVVKAVRTVEAYRRIPDEFKGLTFFSEHDVWLYVPLIDDRTCELCQDYAETEYFMGSELRSKFPYLEIENVDRIWVNVHPNCRCYLVRE